MISLQEIGLGPAALLDMIEEVWCEVEATTESEGIGVDLREVLAQDLFRMGNVLQRLGILRVAAEHHGSSFQLSPLLRRLVTLE